MSDARLTIAKQKLTEAIEAVERASRYYDYLDNADSKTLTEVRDILLNQHIKLSKIQ